MASIGAFRCFVCLSKTSARQALCQTCIDHLSAIDPQYACPKCKTAQASTHLCSHCLKNPWHFNQFNCGFYYDALAKYLLHHLKFYQQLRLIPCLSQLMVTKLKTYFLNETPELIVPTPSHRFRILKRGFNQAHELAKHLSKAYHIPIDPRALHKIKHHKALAQLDAKQRAHTIQNSFKVTLKKPIKHVLLIDDVLTTGATLNAQAQAFLEAGVEKIDIATLFRGYYEKGL